MFADGDFGDFIQPIVDTLDLYHNQEVDPRAIAISFKELAEKHPDAELEIVAMERKGDDKFLLRAKTNPVADKSELSSEYFSNYNQYKGLSESELKVLLIEQTVRAEEKERAINLLKNMVSTTLKRPGFYAENYHNSGGTDLAGDRNINVAQGNYNKNIEGDYVQENKTDQSRNFNNSGTINNSGAGAFNLGKFSGTVANTINKLPSSSNPDKPGIRDLLLQLQATIEDPQVSPEDQKTALTQVQILAAAGQNPQEKTMQKKAQQAVGFLEVIAKGVEPTSKLATTCAKILPLIIAFF